MDRRERKGESGGGLMVRGERRRAKGEVGREGRNLGRFSRVADFFREAADEFWGRI